MDAFIYRQWNENEIDYRLRIWQSRELWDYLQVEWDEDKMPNEMTQKMLEMKHQVYAMSVQEIDEEVLGTKNFMETINRLTVPHEYVWCQMYIIHLSERKTELQMEIAMKTFGI
jgi:hypothetical protein